MIELEFHTLEQAFEARVEWYDHLHRDDNPQEKTVTFADSVPDEAVIAAYESKPLKIGQEPLTEYEKSRYNWGGAYERPNIIEAQCVKAMAKFFGVSDWMAHWDSALSVDENFEIMRREGTRELTFQEKAALGELSYPRHEPPRGATADD